MAHWDAAYESLGASNVSWFQQSVDPSLRLIEALSVPHDAAIVDVGGGASLLVDALSMLGYRDLTVLDISRRALDEVAARLVDDDVALLHEDLLEWTPSRDFDLWHDRAVLHFLVEDRDRDRYLRTLRAAVRSGGAVVLATFAPDGPETCSGLPVVRYGADELMELLGAEFTLVTQESEIHVTPSGAPQSFTWLAARHGASS